MVSIHFITLVVLFLIIDIQYLFFFQAEDGIRDFHVTGVQTCALPISPPSPPTSTPSPTPFRRPPPPPSTVSWAPSSPTTPPWACPWTPNPPAWCCAPRSEERRVGKECRPRWSR